MEVGDASFSVLIKSGWGADWAWALHTADKHGGHVSMDLASVVSLESGS